MAEFKLGRIKFVWKGTWSPSTTYLVDDVINNASKTYICIKSHTSTSLFADDFDSLPTKWELVSDGQRWVGDWTPTTYYEVGDIAKFGANTYVCVVNHTSDTYTAPTWNGIEVDLGLDGSTTPKWELFATSFDFIGEWSNTTRYRINDIVTYGGSVYLCNTPHISDVRGLEFDSSRWDIFNQGVEYLGEWSGATVRYKLNDLVKYGASIWICVEPHFSSVTFDQNNWDVFVNGLEFESSWNNTIQYQVGDTVTYGGYSYIAKTNNINSQPTSNPSDWDVFVTGFNFQGDWQSVTDYKVGDLIRVGGYTYVATADNTNQLPPNTNYWHRLNSGIRWTTSSVTYTGLSGTNLIGTGLSATFDVVRSGTVYSVSVNNQGTGYNDNDEIKILGSSLGGVSPANDLIITVTGNTGGLIDTIDWTGIAISWKSGTTYVLGDVVLYGANNYICVQNHVASSGNKPDVDTTATYWNLFTAGAEDAVLTTEGDTFFFGPTGSTRLPIGEEGQLLRVTNGYPSWEFYGVVNNIVYVGPIGVDSPAPDYGLTIDKPWKTVRFAAEQVEKGYLNPQASLLLEKNKQFIIKEVAQYVEYTYPATVDLVKTERDAGIVLDAVIYDFSHSGTHKTTKAALEYFNAAGTDYVNSTVGSQVTEFVAGLDYLVTVAQDVLSNSAPAQNYQTLNSVADPADQIIDNSLTAELGVDDTVANLVEIVTKALNAGNTSVIPTSIKPQTTISVKTGTYTEVLPIVIPNFVAVVGDELRSTVIQPKPGIDLLTNDKPKTRAVLSHIQGLIPDLISNTSITPTTGNNITQDTTLTAGSVGSTTAINSVVTSVALIRDILENGLSQVPAAVLPSPTNYNTSLTNVAYATTSNPTGSTLNYGDGKAQIAQNYQFIKDEVAAWLNVFGGWAGYPAEKRIATLRDVHNLLDAIQYDLTYGGNRQSLIDGRSYYSENILQISAAYLTDTTGVLGRIKTIISQIATKTSVTPTAGNTTTQVVTGTAGSVGSGEFAADRVQDVIDWIDNGEANATVEPFYGWVSSSLQAAFTALQAKRSEITYDAYLWVKKFYQATTFDFALTERDAGDVVDAISYDLLFGSNFNSLTAGRRYRSDVPSIQFLLSNLLAETSGAINFIGWKAKAIASSGASANTISLLDDIQAQINGVVEAGLTTATTGTNLLTVSSTSGMYPNMPVRFTGLPADTTTTASATAVSTNLITLAASVTSLGIAVNQPIYFTGSVFGNLVRLQKYYVKTASSNTITVSLTIGGATVALINGSGTMTVTVNKAGGLYPNKTYWVNTVTSSTQLTVTESYKSGTAVTIGNTVGSMTASINVGETSEVNGSNDYTNNLGIIRGAEIIRANKNFLAYEATAFTTDTYSATVNTTTGSNNRYGTSSTHPFVVGDPVVFSGTALANSGITIGTTYWILAVPTTTTFTLTTEKGGTTEVDITSDASGSMTVTYAYDEASCRRDMEEYVDALVHDLNFTSNYWSTRAAVQYINAVDGSLLSDMFLVGNATGLRNCTMTGLSGTLTAPNAFGTQRPTAGAYTALNPGFGPADRNVWVIERSHYSQNCTMFGTACTGAKIDSALHDGGNKSMVKNDYTTILSDGIGVWCTGSESLVELVSVFNYYGYAGYLAELGGRIRATNGNSSYGTYGVIAEGVDSYEAPLYANLDNRANQAQVSQVITDGLDEILRFEYGNAGINYTNYDPQISGAGFNATAIGDEFRDSAVFETRIIDPDNGDDVGGEGYLTATNVAQGGTNTSITLAATDTQLSPAYVGMRCFLTTGTGAGQFGWIITYNNGSKIARIAKDSFTTLTVTATSITNNLFTVASTASLYVGMPIYFGTGATNGVTASTLYYIIAANFSSTQFAVSETDGGSAVTVTANASGLTIPLYAAGWDHVIPGTAIENALDLTTGYIIEPRIMYAAPGYTSSAATMSATTTWGSSTYADNNFVAITSNGTSTSYSTNGVNWNSAGALPASTAWTDIVYGGGQGATATAVVGGFGGDGAVLTVTMGILNTNGDPLPDQVASVTVVNGGYGYTSPPTIVFTGGGPGSGTVATATVLDGVIQAVTVDIPGSGYTGTPTATARTDIVSEIVVNTYGRNYLVAPTVTVVGGGYSSQATATATLGNGGVISIEVDDGGEGYTSVPTISILDTSAKFVAIRTSGGAASAYQETAGLGTAWSSSVTNQPAGTYAALVYGAGIYVGIGGTNSAMSSVDGDTWVGRSIPTLGAGTYVDVAFGAETFVAISTGNNATATSANGITWSAGGNLPSSTTWTSIAYGNGRFVAVASGGRTVAYSLDKGATWSAVTPGLPSSQTWSRIAYGQGLFMAVAESATVAATSPDGITWTSRAMPGGSTNWKVVSFGNPNNTPVWIAASNTSGTIGATIRTGARAEARARVTDDQIIEIRMWEPGSGYPKGTVSSTSASTDLITVDRTTNLVNNQPVEFTSVDGTGLSETVTYYVIGSSITSTEFQVSETAGGSAVALSTTSGLTGTYRAEPILTQTEPNNTADVATRVRMGDGALGNPTFTNRGTANTTATASIMGDGTSDLYQVSNFINVKNVFALPLAGANVEFASIPGEYFKLVAVTNVLGIPGNYTVTLQINPSLSTLNAPNDGELITTRSAYSQVRLTGHDFLYIGTGNFSETNYPNVDTSTAITANQTFATGGGRVFFTSTDQDGNFNVGNLFGVQQSTGTATLNASAFNLSGLQSLQLGSLGVGTGSAVITQFSTDPYFTANSDSVVPTQRAIKSYITSQIGGGQSSLNVNTLTAGVIYVANNTISTTSGEQINVKAKMNFTGGIDGAPVALAWFLQR